jgi:hypothetical protein
MGKKNSSPLQQLRRLLPLTDCASKMNSFRQLMPPPSRRPARQDHVPLPADFPLLPAAPYSSSEDGANGSDWLTRDFAIRFKLAKTFDFRTEPIIDIGPLLASTV